MNTNISKSLFTKHLQCEKAYYLHSRKIIVPEITLSQQLLFDSGREYEKYVHKMERFKNSIHIQEQCSTMENKMNFTKMLSLTKKMLEREDTVLFEATLSSTFKQNINLFCMIDVLKPNHDGSWDIYEIKSTKSVKPQHIVELTFQYFTSQQYGLNIRDVHIIHFNGDYVLKDTLDIESLSEVICKTSEVKKEVQNIDKHIQSIQLTSQLERINTEVNKKL